MQTVTKREAALRELQKLVGVREEGLNNRGRMVDAITRADKLPGVGYSWCQSTQNYAWALANGEMLAGGTASVWYFMSWAQTGHARLLAPWEPPARADHVTFAFHSTLPYDHVGQVERVISVGPVLVLQTIEGNTGPIGAVSDPGTGRDGVYRKRRVVLRSRVAFVRVPGNCPHPERYAPKPTPYQRWRAWYLAGRKPGRRPADAPRKISAAWWKKLRADLARRKRRTS